MEEERSCKRLKTFDGASSSAAPGSEYQVFLSFRGEETRKKITDHLYCRLKDAGIRTFRDNEALHVGKEIGSELLRAIQESTISVPIISKGYASSKWCLIELTHMLKCSKIPGHEVWPIFYDVTPSDCKNQTGSFEEAFLQHSKKFDDRTVQEWKEALAEVAELKGWEKDKVADGYEGELVKKVASEICMKLKRNNVNLTDILVGMGHHEEQIDQLLDINCDDVRIVGIHGMGGIGKTTIAKSMYNKLCDHFQHQCSFLEDVREKVKQHNGYDGLRNQLISDILKRKADGITLDKNTFSEKKVLIVLDDVEKRSQVDQIFESREWFGPGSRIIVTTRDKDVFIEDEGDRIYAPSKMNFDDSLRLFCKHAFKSTHPSKDYEGISRKVVVAAAGLPLYLVVIGSLLYPKKKITYWEAKLKELEAIPPSEVQERLKISYNALTHGQQQIFLDIACHFIGEDKILPIYMWEDCKFFPETGIDVLISLSLISIETKNDYLSGDANVFRMHDHLRDLGRNIVLHKENPNDLGQSSRLWSPEEANEVLKDNREKTKVETLDIHYDGGLRSECLSSNNFKTLSNLRYLCLEGTPFRGDFKGLLPNLRWFRWSPYWLWRTSEYELYWLLRTSEYELYWLLRTSEYKLEKASIAVTNFCPNKLVILDLSESEISDSWEGWTQIKGATNLKVLNLSRCTNLRKTPNVSSFSNLERLILRNCHKLTEIGTIGMLEKLQVLNCSGCELLEGELPNGIWSLSSLDILNLSGTKVDMLTDDIGNMCNLRVLGLSKSKIKKLPKVGIERLQRLEYLDCSGCESLEGELPNGIWSLSSLDTLNLSGTKVDMLTDDIGNMCNLRVLDLSKSKIKKLPKVGIERLQKLEYLNCSGCESLEGELPNGIWSLSSLDTLTLSGTKVDMLTDDIGNMCNLRVLDLSESKIKKLPKVGIERLQRLEYLNCPGCESLEGELPNGIWSLSSLNTLKLSGTKVDMLTDDIGNMCNLRVLNLSNSKIKKLPKVGIERLQKLEYLNCSGCESLEGELPNGIWSLSSLNTLNLSGTKVDMLTDDIGNMCNLRVLDLSNSKIKKLPKVGIERLQRLEYLDCFGCESLEGELPNGIWSLSSLNTLNLSGTKVDMLTDDIGNMCNLSVLNLSKSKIKKLPKVGIEMLEWLVYLDCSGCESLEGELPNGIWSLSSLDILDLSGTKVDMLTDDIGNMCNLSVLDLSESKIKKLPKVGIERLQRLEHLDCSGCESLEGELPNGIWSLSSLDILDLSGTKVDMLTDDIGNMCNLRVLDLSESKIKKLPKVGIERLQRLEYLDCSGCESLEGEFREIFRSLSSISELYLSDTKLKFSEKVRSWMKKQEGLSSSKVNFAEMSESELYSSDSSDF